MPNTAETSVPFVDVAMTALCRSRIRPAGCLRLQWLAGLGKGVRSDFMMVCWCGLSGADAGAFGADKLGCRDHTPLKSVGKAMCVSRVISWIRCRGDAWGPSWVFFRCIGLARAEALLFCESCCVYQHTLPEYKPSAFTQPSLMES